MQKLFNQHKFYIINISFLINFYHFEYKVSHYYLQQFVNFIHQQCGYF